MAQRINTSPSVTIVERDLSLRAPANVGTNVFVTGFTHSGPSDEVLKITSRDELDNVYGKPTNSSERYFYHTVSELLNSPAQIYTFRIPYGTDLGDGFGTEHTALVYPVVSYKGGDESTTNDLNIDDGVYFLGEPIQLKMTENQFRSAIEGTLFNWTSTATLVSALTALSAIGGAGVIVLDKAQTTINSQFEGYYVGVADNVNMNPATNFDSIKQAKTTSLTASYVGFGSNGYTQIPNGTLQFNLASDALDGSNSISRIMENLTEYDISSRNDDDLLSVGVFKIRKTVFATESFKLDYVLDDAIVGSINAYRMQLNPSGGALLPFFLESQDTNSRNVEILVNPYISNKFTESSLGSDGIPKKKIRVLTNSIVTNYPAISSTIENVPLSALSAAIAAIGTADALYPLGAYSPERPKQKLLGNIPAKIDRALASVINDEIYDIDVVVEAGLGTIYSMASAAGTQYYDDTLYNSTLKSRVDGLRTSNEVAGPALDIVNAYVAIAQKFTNFCGLPVDTGGRGDCIFIADPIRHIMLTGRDNKVLSDRTLNFQKDVYWPMRHQFTKINTSYATAYANWVKVLDDATGEFFWSPFSGFQAAIIARSDANEFPWSAPAGFNRGLIQSKAVDVAINPNQKQRDELYKVNLNPIFFSPAQGMVVFGQKTLLKRPSAFDRINVRRLFQALERPTKRAAQYFVFEPNNEFTRTRLVNVLTPIFEFAKQNGGLYDYLIVCDERNNTPEIIDNNELKVDILLKATRTAEFITVVFTASRTDANFEELI